MGHHTGVQNAKSHGGAQLARCSQWQSASKLQRQHLKLLLVENLTHLQERPRQSPGKAGIPGCGLHLARLPGKLQLLLAILGKLSVPCWGFSGTQLLKCENQGLSHLLP